MDEPALVSRLGGLLAGDLIGSAYEGQPGGRDRVWVTPHSSLTDDSLMAVATARAAEACGENPPTRCVFEGAYRACIARAASMRNYFSPDMLLWVEGEAEGGFMEGNGAGIRAAALALTAGPEADLAEAVASAVRITHSSEATVMATALADAITLLRDGFPPSELMAQMEMRVPMVSVYDADYYRSAPMDTTLWWTLPAALHIGLTSQSYSALFEEVLFVGGDTDSIGAMAGAIGHARWGLEGLPANILRSVEEGLSHAAFARC